MPPSDYLSNWGILEFNLFFFDEVYYCTKCNKYVEKCMHGLDNNSRISGSEVRNTILKGKSLPDWFIRESVLNQINDFINNGYPIFYDDIN